MSYLWAGRQSSGSADSVRRVRRLIRFRVDPDTLAARLPPHQGWERSKEP